MDEAASTICRYYNYTLQDIFQKKWRDGGLTFGQIEVLYTNLQKQLNEELKFNASMHGFSTNIKEEHKPTPQLKNDNETLIFGDPASYNHLSKEEREELTQKMMKRHKMWAVKQKMGK